MPNLLIGGYHSFSAHSPGIRLPCSRSWWRAGLFPCGVVRLERVPQKARPGVSNRIVPQEQEDDPEGPVLLQRGGQRPGAFAGNLIGAQAYYLEGGVGPESLPDEAGPLVSDSVQSQFDIIENDFGR